MVEYPGVKQLAAPRRHVESGFDNWQVHLKAGDRYYLFSHTSRVALTGSVVGQVLVEGMLFYADVLGQRGDGVYFTDIETTAAFEVGLDQAKRWLSKQLEKIS